MQEFYLHRRYQTVGYGSVGGKSLVLVHRWQCHKHVCDHLCSHPLCPDSPCRYQASWLRVRKWVMFRWDFRLTVWFVGIKRWMHTKESLRKFITVENNSTTSHFNWHPGLQWKNPPVTMSVLLIGAFGFSKFLKLARLFNVELTLSS